MKLIGTFLFNPKTSIFKWSKNERAEARKLYCSLNECPLLAKGQCVHAGLFSRCPYGKTERIDGPTGRVKGFHKWISDHAPTLPWPKDAPKKLAFIGEYIYLPYTHMDMCESVPFLKHSNVFSSGMPFLKDFTISVITTLIDFRPTALFGGEITQYQKEQVPLFVSHLREECPDHYKALITLRPELDKAPNYVGRKALVRTLNPCTIPAKDSRYPVVWTWDGTVLRTNDLSAYNSTWGGIDLKEIMISSVPIDAVVTVCDNSWVNDTTEFID